ncbi:Hypothetical_protein [Hexamita inflata]|uniref:Hypothetical_protein n=1 Tax=Hexamita inflata TaxID=28002 RepID=A0AA86N6I3_9EUKA|nr:Hypothetical protein HINF_LOCUS1432 [Hexamita inflata]
MSKTEIKNFQPALSSPQLESTQRLISQSEECLSQLKRLRLDSSIENNEQEQFQLGQLKKQIGDLVQKSTHLMRHNMQLRDQILSQTNQNAQIAQNHEELKLQVDKLQKELSEKDKTISQFNLYRKTQETQFESSLKQAQDQNEQLSKTLSNFQNVNGQLIEQIKELQNKLSLSQKDNAELMVVIDGHKHIDMLYQQQNEYIAKMNFK